MDIALSVLVTTLILTVWALVGIAMGREWPVRRIQAIWRVMHYVAIPAFVIAGSANAICSDRDSVLPAVASVFMGLFVVGVFAGTLMSSAINVGIRLVSSTGGVSFTKSEVAWARYSLVVWYPLHRILALYYREPAGELSRRLKSLEPHP